MHKNAEFFATRDYRLILQREFEARRSRRPVYSLNAFARDLGISASRLNSILKGRYGISNATALAIARKLKFSEKETEFFSDLIALKHARNLSERRRAGVRLSMYTTSEASKLEDNQSGILKHWYYAATLYYVKVKNGKVTPQSVAKALDITAEQATESLKVLEQIGELNRDNDRYTFESKVIKAASPTSSKVIQNFHVQFLDQLKKVILRDPPLRRKNLSAYVAFDSSRMEEARVWLEKVHDDFFKEFSVPGQNDCVCNLGLYLSRTDKEIDA